MANFQTHLTILRTAALTHPNAILFKITLPTTPISYQEITYQGFLSSITDSAIFWSQKLRLPVGSVVGLWLNGFLYSDYVHIFGISMAGYIPQLFSIRLPNPKTIRLLLEKSGAKAVIMDKSFEGILDGHIAPSICELEEYIAHQSNSNDENSESLESISSSPQNCQDSNSEISANSTIQDFAQETGRGIIHHTSGSTSGIPKIITSTPQKLHGMVLKSYFSTSPGISTAMGSICHIAQLFLLIGGMQHRCTTIIPSAIPFPVSELKTMIQEASLQKLFLFSSFLSVFLRATKEDQELLDMLRSLESVVHSGLPLPVDDMEYALREGIRLQNIYGSTECGGGMMISPIGKPDCMIPYPVVDYRFTDKGELVVRKDSVDCTPEKLRDESGEYWSGDLFERSGDEGWRFLGRVDDLMKMENGLCCEPRWVEEEVMRRCEDLVVGCVVVGQGRKAPVIFVEVEEDREGLRAVIVERLRDWMEGRYLHERVTDERFVVVVAKGELPRTETKGNIRRKAVEEQWKGFLDKIYGNC
ncbi:acetyl-CoA synthetase-like protein [Pyronema omphalodes]|nr:acetyl-CoA synthetase-like protein [Pyronema omphalodes]